MSITEICFNLSPLEMWENCNDGYQHTYGEHPHMTIDIFKKQRNQLLFDFLSNSWEVNTLFQEIYDQKWFWQWRYHKHDVLNHTILVVRNFMEQYEALNLLFHWKIKRYFDEQIDGVPKLLLVQLWLVFHDAWKKTIHQISWTMRWHAAYTVQYQLQEITKRFGLHEAHRMYLENIVLYHDVPLEDENNNNTRVFLQNHAIYIEGLLISLADILSCEWKEIRVERLEKRRKFVLSELEKELPRQS